MRRPGALAIAADVTGDLQGLGVQVNGLPVITQVEVAEPQATQYGALALAIANVTGDLQGLGVQVNGLPVITQAGVAEPQATQYGALALAIANVAVDIQGLGVQVDGLPVITQAGIALPQTVQVIGVEIGVRHMPVNAPTQVDQCAVVAPPLQVIEVDVLQHGGRGVVIAGVAAQLELGELQPNMQSRVRQDSRGVRIWLK